jgi:hypothetical protein
LSTRESEYDVTDPDAKPPLGQPARPRPDQPVRLILTAHPNQPPRIPLIDWIHRDPRYRAAVRDSGGRRDGRAGFSDAVIIAVVAEALLPGLFGLLQTWVTEQRTETHIRVRVGDSEIEVKVTGRSDPKALLAEVTRSHAAIDAVAEDRQADEPAPERSRQYGHPHSPRFPIFLKQR